MSSSSLTYFTATTKYERARLIGIRAEQIARGSPVFIDTKNMTNHMEIAEKEYDMGKCPLLVERSIIDSDIDTK